jgi:hypothetical protein
MKKSLLFLLGVIACGTMLTGCASIVTGTSQDVSFQTQPEGATVIISGKTIGKTPLTTNLKKESKQTVSFEKEGYKTQTMQLSTRLNSWFWGNIVIGGVIGSTTDGLSGAVHEYTPDQYFITLPPNENTHIDQTTKQKMQAKEFIVLAYRNIMVDVSKGSGEYLDSLMNSLSVQPNDRKEAASKIKTLSELYQDIPTFADRVLELYLK